MGDRALHLDLSDPTAAAEAIVALARRAPIDAVVAVDDQGVLVAAEAAARLGLPANPPAAVAATRDKAAMRRALAAAGVPQPAFRVVGPEDDVAAVASARRVPVRGEAGVAVGQPRRHPRRRPGGGDAAAARVRAHPRATPATTPTGRSSSSASSPAPRSRSRGCCAAARSRCSPSSTSPTRSTARTSRRRSTSRPRACRRRRSQRSTVAPAAARRRARAARGPGPRRAARVAGGEVVGARARGPLDRRPLLARAALRRRRVASRSSSCATRSACRSTACAARRPPPGVMMLPIPGAGVLQRGRTARTRRRACPASPASRSPCPSGARSGRCPRATATSASSSPAAHARDVEAALRDGPRRARGRHRRRLRSAVMTTAETQEHGIDSGGSVRVLLVSTYELGHQPLHVASPGRRAAGRGPRGARRRPGRRGVGRRRRSTWADAVAFSVPMHTAMRLALRAAARCARSRPDVPICLYGLYAPVSRDHTLGTVADRLLAGEYEAALVAWVDGLATRRRPSPAADQTVVHLGRTRFRLPARDLLPPLDRYARLVVDGEERLVGYVEASHGCAHRCRHCPVPVVYDGRIRIVDLDAVVADVAQLVAAGARHITFGDPDFLNGVHHSLRVVRAVHDRFPDLTFDCTTKVEHILRHASVWAELAAAGCLFVVSAFESVNDAILAAARQGPHRRRRGAGRSRCCAGTASRSGRRSCRSRRGRPWPTSSTCSSSSPPTTSSTTSTRCSTRSACCCPRARCCSTTPTSRRTSDRTTPSCSATRGRQPIPPSTRSRPRLARAGRSEPRGGRDHRDDLPARRAERGRRRDAVRPRGRPPGRPRLTEPWFCCAEPTEASSPTPNSLHLGTAVVPDCNNSLGVVRTRRPSGAPRPAPSCGTRPPPGRGGWSPRRSRRGSACR